MRFNWLLVGSVVEFNLWLEVIITGTSSSIIFPRKSLDYESR